MTFVRSAIGPDAYPHLEVVRLAEIKEDRGLAMVRTRARFAPTAPKPPGAPAQAIAFGDPVTLIRAPFHISFAYAGPDRVWLPSWKGREQLPEAVGYRSGTQSPIGCWRRRPWPASGSPPPARPSLKHKRMRAALFLRPDRRSSNESPAMTSLPRSATRAECGFVLVAVLWILAALATPCVDLFFLHCQYRRRIPGGRRPRAGGGLDLGRRRNGGLQPTRAPREGQTGPGRLRLARGSHWRRRSLSLRGGKDRPQRRALGLADRAIHRGRRRSVAGGNFRGAHRRLANEGRASADAKQDTNAPGTDATNAPGVPAPNAPPSTDATNAQVGNPASNAQPGAGATNAQVGDPAKEDKLYVEQHMPYPPRHAPFDNALELSLLPGISLAVVGRVLPFVTVFSGREGIDVSTADPTVLSALPEMTPQILGAVLNARVTDPGDGRTLLALLGPAKSHATADTSKEFRASISVEFDNGRRIHAEVVFRLKDQNDKDKGDNERGLADQGGKDQGTGGQGAKNQNAEDKGADPYELLYWRDDFDGPMQSA